ncbi:MAG: ABC-F family ATP-binding cassette domain-containing protein [Deltaproteobacteria bacterium]|nr:MAG: ABC-F family ATP-binding cassette domain-containing protein [Deltaproteobacteria bacterium]
MIRLDDIALQHGRQVLFVGASAVIHRGEHVGLVGPNGAGKSTLFRLITKAEEPDEGQVSVDRGVTIGHFSQDVGEMKGKTVVGEAMDGAGPVSKIAAELRDLEHALADPGKAAQMESLLERFGDVQARFEGLGGYGLEARAREILAGLGFSQERMDQDVGELSGGWKMRVALARILLMNPDALLLDEPSNHLDLESLIWLESFLAGFEGAILITSHDREFLNRVVGKIIEIDAEVEPPKMRKTVEFEFGRSPRSGEDVARLAKVSKSYGSKVIYDDFDFLVRRTERWCVLGVNGAGKTTLLKLVAGATGPDDGEVSVGGSVKMGYFAQHAMDVLEPEKSVWETVVDAFPKASVGALRTLLGCFGFSGDEADKPVRVLSGGEKARVVLARMLFDPPNFLVLDEPTNHLDLLTKEMLINALRSFEGTMLFVSHDRHFLAELSNRVLELTPEGPHVYGGGYTEYVSRTGREAPGLRS